MVKARNNTSRIRIDSSAFLTSFTNNLATDQCDPNRIRIGVYRMRTCRPRPLDDGTNEMQL
jgi:hypothetical protein